MFRMGVQSAGLREGETWRKGKGDAWKKIETRFEQLIEKLYNKLRYSPQTQGNVNPT